MERSKWEYKEIHHSTGCGDYDGHYEITDGRISLCTNDDPEDITDTENSLQQIARLLNETGCKFYSNNALELEQHIDIMKQSQEIDELQARCERYEKALKEVRGKTIEAIFPHLPVESMASQKIMEIEQVVTEALSGEGEKGAAPVIEQGAVWVKAGERLPGWAQVVKWRDETGKKLPGMSAVSDLSDQYPTSLEGFEWLYESAGEKEDIKDGKDLTAYYQKVESAIGFATWLTKNSWGRLKDEQWMSTFTKEVAPITELYQRFEKEGKQ